MSTLIHRNATELHDLIRNKHQAAQPLFAQCKDYQEQVLALSREYHKERLREAFPDLKFIEDRIVVGVVNASSTPKTLEKLITAIQVGELRPKEVVFDYKTDDFYILA